MSTYAVPTRGELPGAWVERAACAGHPRPDMWHDISGGRPNQQTTAAVPAEALIICQQCPVRAACLEYALDTPSPHDWGLWGATTPEQRRALRKGRAA